MSATIDPQSSNQYPKDKPEEASSKRKGKILNLSSKMLLTHHLQHHHSKAGLNPVVDAACRLFSILGKLNSFKFYNQLDKLQKELISEMFFFQDTLENLGYDSEYILICQYILCATFDDIISHTSWGLKTWNDFYLLNFFSSEPQNQDRFFPILERTVQEAKYNIDVMELIYICLSMGYKGCYRLSNNGQFQLEQISNNLYKHIRVSRGNFSKSLSPAPLKIKTTLARKPAKIMPMFFIFFASVCAITIIFFGLSYLMDVISNEAYQKIVALQKPISNLSVKQ